MASRIVAEVELGTAGVSRGVAAVDSKLGGLRKSASSTGSVFKGVLGANILGKGVQLAGAGIQKFTGLLGDSVAEARESVAVGKTTAQIIKATGGAAKVTADQVGALATRISNKTGVDDEAIQSGSNLLLTFKNVRNEAGKGGKVFDRASAAAVDLSKAGFGSITGSSKMLGKALNDPVKGISALSRAGVTFTAQQKEQIKTLVASGDTLGAQKIILGEVESQVGGVAAANASAADKAKVLAGNLKEQFGTTLLPLLDRAAGFFTTTLGPAISTALTAIGPVLDQVAAQVGPVFTGLLATVGPIIQQIAGHFTAVGAAFTAAFSGGGGGGGVATFIAQLQPLGTAVAAIFGAVSTVIRAVLPIVVGVVTQIVAVFQQNLPAIQSAVSAVTSTLSSIASIITSVWTRIGPIVLPIVTAVFGTLIGVISGAFNVVAGIFKVISSVLKGDWSGAWNGIKQIMSGSAKVLTSIVQGLAGILGAIWGGIKSSALSVWNAIRGGVVAAATGLVSKVRGLIDGLRAANAAVWNGIRSAITGAIGAAHSAVTSRVSSIRSTISSAWNTVKSATSAAWNTVKTSVTNAVSSAVSTVTSKVSSARSAVSGAWSAVTSATSSAWSSFTSTISSKVSSALATVQGIPGRISGALGNLGSLLYGAGSAVVQGFINGITGAIGGAVSAAASLARSALNAANAALGVASPSKVFKEIGAFVGKGLALGILGTASQVGAASKKLASQVTAAFKANPKIAKSALLRSLNADVSRLRKETSAASKAASSLKKNNATIAKLRRKGTTKAEAKRIVALRKSNASLGKIAARRSQLNKALHTAQSRLFTAKKRDPKSLVGWATDRTLAMIGRANVQAQKIATQRAAVAKKLAAANTKLTDMVKQRADYYAAVRDSARSFASIIAIEAPENVTLNSKMLVTGLTDRLNAITNFTRRLAALKRLGINDSTYAQIVGAGVEGGMESLNALLAGGKAAVTSVNSLQGKINSVTSALGTQTSDVLYKTGIDAQKGLIRGLESDQKALAAAAKRIATTLTTEIKRALKIKSPSRVFRSIGDNTVKGLVQGLDNPTVGAAGRSMAKSLVHGFGDPALAAQAGTGGLSQPTVVNVTINAPTLGTKVEVGRWVKDAMKEHDRVVGRR